MRTVGRIFTEVTQPVLWGIRQTWSHRLVEWCRSGQVLHGSSLRPGGVEGCRGEASLERSSPGSSLESVVAPSGHPEPVDSTTFGLSVRQFTEWLLHFPIYDSKDAVRCSWQNYVGWLVLGRVFPRSRLWWTLCPSVLHWLIIQYKQYLAIQLFPEGAKRGENIFSHSGTNNFFAPCGTTVHFVSPTVKGGV